MILCDPKGGLMKARLFVVNENTIVTTINNNEVSIMVPEPQGAMWNKTIIDIMSDLFQVEVGDYIFLWESSDNNKNRIHGVYRAISKPFYKIEKGKNDPFKIKIERAYLFEKPIDEYDVINNPNMKNELWTIIGKKVAGKSRGTTPLTNREMEFLIQSLIDKNGVEYKFIEESKEINVKNELTIDLNNNYVGDIPKSLEQFDVNQIKHRDGVEVHFEKSLEAIMNYLFREKVSDVLAELDINVDNVFWFGNYLPYGIERSEIDYMIMETKDGQVNTKIDVVEFMKGKIDESHIERSLLYSRWVKDSIGKGNNIVRPILICGPTSKLTGKNSKIKKLNKCIRDCEKEAQVHPLDIYTYSIGNGTISFTKLERGEEDE